MDYTQAKAAAIAGGVAQDDLTAEVIAMYGWSPEDPLKNVNPADPKLTDEQVKQTMSALQAEAKANAWPAHVTKMLLAVAKYAIPMVLVFVLVGCSSQAAKMATDQAQQSIVASEEGHAAIHGEWFKDYHDRQVRQIEELHAKAVESVTKNAPVTITERILVRTPKPDGTFDDKYENISKVETQRVINPVTHEALLRRKLEMYEQMELKLKEMREKVAKVSKNNANAFKLMEGLKEYFDGKAATYEAMNEAQDAALKYLDSFLGKKATPAP